MAHWNMSKSTRISGTLAAMEALDTAVLTGSVFAENIDWLRGVAKQLFEADPENALASLPLTRIDGLVQLFNSLILGSDDALKLRRATVEIAETIKDAMAFQAKHTALSPEQVAEIERNAYVKAGIQSVEAQKEKFKERQSYEAELAKAIRAEHDDYSQRRLAKAMLRRAKLDGKKLPGEKKLHITH